MPVRFPAYRMRDGVTPLSEDYFNPLLSDIDARIAQLEDQRASLQGVIDELTALGLQRIDVLIGPAIAQTQATLDALQELRADLEAAVAAADIKLTAFGLGGAAAPVPGGNIDAASIPTGFYYVLATTSGTKPAGDDGYGHLIVSREGGGTTARQLYLDNATNRIWTRAWAPSQWSGWVEIYHSGNISAANAGTATKLQAARTITIGNASKSFDGSANVSWTLTEILSRGVPETAQELGGGVDLNTIQTPGFYVQSENSEAASGANYPGASPGALVVLRNAVGVSQLYYSYGDASIAPRVFFRAFYSGSWSTWREVYHSGNLDGYRIKNIRTISAVGSGTFTPTPGTNAMMVWVLGGGGSGAYATDGAGGGGGGGGGCAFAFITKVVASYNYTVGAGGALAAQGSHGNSGMASSFSTPSGSLSITGDGGAGGRTYSNWGYRFGGGGGLGSITSSSSEISASIIYPGQAGLGGYGSNGEGPAGVAGGGNHLFCNSVFVGHYQAGATPPPGCGGNGNLGSGAFTPTRGGNGFILIREFV